MSMIGKTLGNFEFTALLGMGGMIKIYQANDKKLGRDMAIMVLLGLNFMSIFSDLCS